MISYGLSLVSLKLPSIFGQAISASLVLVDSKPPAKSVKHVGQVTMKVQ